LWWAAAWQALTLTLQLPSSLACAVDLLTRRALGGWVAQAVDLNANLEERRKSAGLRGCTFAPSINPDR
jgi:hypothetical protein